MHEAIKIEELVKHANSYDEHDILVIDSLKSYMHFNNLDINSNTDMYGFMLLLRQLIIQSSMSIILIHHAIRSANNQQPRFYGSSAVEEQCDSGFMYTKHSSPVLIVKSRLGYLKGVKVELTKIK
jgi:RecA-family ATPase